MMRRKLERVTEWLLCASEQVAPEYLQLPVAGKEELEYRERVYCYELYHRWRCHWPEDFRFSLSGEVDKSGHRRIRQAYKPDFLVHVPGQMKNLLVMEVKPGNANLAEMWNDLKKLTYFRRDLPPENGQPGNYFAAYFWLYGLLLKEWPTLRMKLLSAQPSPEFDQALVSCFIHESPATRALQVSWE